MHRFFKILILPALLLSMAACNGKNKSATLPALPALSLVATHAIETPKQYTALVFVPNNSAPWVGRIIVRDKDGKLYSTDIEGSAFIAIEGRAYKNIYGLPRENAAGIFIAINQMGKIEAFIESDDDGGFSPLTYSGKELSANQFCSSSVPAHNQAAILTRDGNIVTIKLAVKNGIIEQEIVKTLPAPDMAAPCAVNGNKIYVAHKNQKNLSLYKDEKWHKLDPFPLGKSIEYQTLDKPYISQIHDGNAQLRFASDIAQGYRLDINDGLSIRGIKQAHYMASTSANYGGGAFKDGVLALFDANETRIVFLSRGYVADMLGREGTPAP